MNSVYLNYLLISLLGSDDLVTAWWNSPNHAFKGEYPRDVDYETLKQYLESQCFK
jgi:hypothetical protein